MTDGYGYTGVYNLTVIDGSVDRIVANIPFTSALLRPAFDSANGHLYVPTSRAGEGVVTVIDGATTRIIRNITVLEPSAIVWDNASGYLYGTYPGYGNLTVIDGSNDSVIGAMTVGFYPFGVIGSPYSVYVTNYGSGTISMTKNPRVSPGGPGGTPVPGLPANVGYALIGAIAVVIVAGATLAFVVWKRKRATRPHAPPPPTAPPRPP